MSLSCAMILLISGIQSFGQEYRALWVDTFGEGIRSSAEIDTLLSTLRGANFNAVIVEVRKRGDAYYNGNFEPKATDVTPQSFDPVAYLIQ